MDTDSERNRRTATGGPVAADAVNEQLSRMLVSAAFRSTNQLSRFLRFVVEETLAGRSDQLKAYTIAVSVLGRQGSFDPQADATVRILAGRLRARLDQYYSDAGKNDRVRITIPKGCYVPSFEPQPIAAARDSSRGEQMSRNIVSSKPSVAVLPLANLDGRSEDDYFAMGLTEQLILNLSNYNELLVLPRYATLCYRDQSENVSRIGQALGIRFVLEGSVRKVGQTVRVNVYLSDVDSGRQIWAQTYERTISVENLLAVQDQIAESVAVAIGDLYGGVITRLMERESSTRPREPSLIAYEALLHYFHFFSELTPKIFAETRGAIESALQHEPNNPELLAMLSAVRRVGYGLGFSSEGNPLAVVMPMARRAVSLNPLSQIARVNLAGAYQLARDPSGMVREAEVLISFKPYGTLYAVAGWNIALAGQWERGLKILREQMVLLPYYPGWLHLAEFMDCYRKFNYDAALREAHLLNTPTILIDPLLRAAAFGQLGMHTQGEGAINELLELCPAFLNDSRRYVNWLIPFDELVDHLFEGVRKAGLAIV